MQLAPYLQCLVQRTRGAHTCFSYLVLSLRCFQAKTQLSMVTEERNTLQRENQMLKAKQPSSVVSAVSFLLDPLHNLAAPAWIRSRASRVRRAPWQPDLSSSSQPEYWVHGSCCGPQVPSTLKVVQMALKACCRSLFHP